MDIYTRECLAIEVGQRLKREDVVRVMTQLVKERNNPKQLFLDNGSEFSSKVLDKWAYEHHIALAFSRPGNSLTMLILNRSMGASEMNVQTCTGFYPWKMPK